MDRRFDELSAKIDSIVLGTIPDERIDALMAAFDDALSGLAGKVQQLIDKYASGDAAVQEAQRKASEAQAAADAVIADDAASDAAQDQARADALSALGGVVDAALNPGGGGTPPA